jgi:hypothetical protein
LLSTSLLRVKPPVVVLRPVATLSAFSFAGAAEAKKDRQ